MRKWLLLTSAVAALTVAALTGVAAGPQMKETKSTGPTEAVERVLLAVEGMTCGSCESRIRETLEAHPAVRKVGVDLASRTVTVDYAKDLADPKILADRVTGVGYRARFLSAGPQLPPPAEGGARPRSGCGGNCCSGG